jgi:hypothetical protein
MVWLVVSVVSVVTARPVLSAVSVVLVPMVVAPV